MTDVWQLLTALADSSSGWAAIALALLATFAVILLLVLAVLAALLGWGLFSYVRRWLGWRARPQRDSY